MTTESLAAIAIARHVPAYEAPGRERRAARRLRKSLTQLRSRDVPCVSVSVHDGDVFAFLRFLVSSDGRNSLVNENQQLLRTLYALTGKKASKRSVLAPNSSWEASKIGIYDVYTTPSTASLLAIIAFRPAPLFPLNMGSARRAVTFVHGYIALVTANAYISTLGGGHFLCLHLKQAKLMARLQIAISDALHDPVLKSKCRVNLAYNAMREGRFRRAKQLIEGEELVAKELVNDELKLICEAAQVYLAKTIKLHHEFMRKRADLSVKDRAVVDNFYRQRIVRKAK